MTRWQGSIALVTGASRGIGRDVALAAAARGARVGLMARSRADLDSVLAEMGEGHTALAADVAERARVVEAITSLEAALGPVDILVNNAGIGAYGAVIDAAPAVFERTLAVNYLGAVHVTRAVLPGMMRRRRGHIVNIGSVSGRIGTPFEAAYSASKFALVGFSEALSVEVAPWGIGVSLVEPGPVATGFFEARGHSYGRAWPKPVAPERVAAAVIAAVEHGRGERYVPGGFRVAHALKTLLPPLYRFGTRRNFARELAALARAHDAGAP